MKVPQKEGAKAPLNSAQIVALQSRFGGALPVHQAIAMLVEALRLVGYAILSAIPETHPAGLWQPIELLGIAFQTVCPHQSAAEAIPREGLDAFRGQVIAAKTRRQRLWRRVMRTMGMRRLIATV